MSEQPRVALFVTCLVDLIRPSVGFAAVELLERADCKVFVPRAQTCCGQPAFNSGDRSTTTRIARKLLDALEGYDYVVVPSGSCGGMIKKHYPELFENDQTLYERACDLSERTFELVSFLTDVLKVEAVDARYDGRVTYHDACAGLRELKVKQQPRRLLASVEGLELVEMDEPEVCCGFGGTFCVKYPSISTRMVANKSSDIVAQDAPLVLAGDLGCLMNIAGYLHRTGSDVAARHIAEVLAGHLEAPPIGGRPGGGPPADETAEAAVASQ